MLHNLTISNFAIIDRLEVQFDEGFNVLTGETGAGKSIILDAFGLLLGDRARPDLVRAGAAEATVEALFDLSGQDAVRQAYADAGFAVEDELVLRRVVQSGGRSRAYVNGNMVTLAQLQPLAEMLVMVCGQHEHHSLLHRGAHLAILDQYGNLAGPLKAYRGTFKEWQEASRKLEELDTAERDREQRLDFLRHQSAEIEAAQLSASEEEDLLAERLLLQNAERLAEISSGGYEALYAGDGAVCEILGRLNDELQKVADVDPELGKLAEAVQRSMFELEDVAAQLRSCLGRVSFEPNRLEAVEERLNELTRLKRKYAPTVPEILEMKETLDAEINLLENAGATREELAGKLSKLEHELMEAGRRLTSSRKDAAKQLAEKLLAELNDLAMGGASFEVAFTALEKPGHDGLERAEFMGSLNPGEPLQSVAKVASGGELSRLMLALKRLAPEADQVPTIIFDEVDAGIGGAAATAVGRKLKAVSSVSQVLCVTHLPQVAAFADHHHRVVKHESGGRTTTSIQQLPPDERVQEMARMLGGAQVTEQTLLHARELIEGSAGMPVG